MHILHACISTLFMHDQILASYAEEKVAKKLKHRPFSSLPTIQNLIAYNVQMERVYLCTQRGKGVVD